MVQRNRVEQNGIHWQMAAGCNILEYSNMQWNTVEGCNTVEYSILVEQSAIYIGKQYTSRTEWSCVEYIGIQFQRSRVHLVVACEWRLGECDHQVVVGSTFHVETTNRILLHISHIFNISSNS